jgi:hypothetical protein
MKAKRIAHSGKFHMTVLCECLTEALSRVAKVVQDRFICVIESKNPEILKIWEVAQKSKKNA